MTWIDVRWRKEGRMWNGAIVSTMLAFLTVLATDWPATAKTVDTFDFTDSSDWFSITGGGVPAGITLTGSFTGTVEADGHIAQADLTDFSMIALIGFTKASLVFFSYDTTGEASSLDIIAQTSPITNTFLCLGASATLSLTCNALGENPFNARGIRFRELGRVRLYTARS